MLHTQAVGGPLQAFEVLGSPALGHLVAQVPSRTLPWGGQRGQEMRESGKRGGSGGGAGGKREGCRVPRGCPGCKPQGTSSGVPHYQDPALGRVPLGQVAP